MIKVKAKWPWPGRHGLAPPHQNIPPMPSSQPTFTIGAPCPLNGKWTCGTDVVWPVYEVNGVAIKPDENGSLPGVCRHQIEARD
jgi:hypothetical protein